MPEIHPPHAGLPGPHAAPPRIILSFDVEEHYRIEAAAGLTIAPAYKDHCRERLDISTRWILERLARDGVRATFFIVGCIAEHNPGLIREIHRAGHEIASHSWDHRRVHHFTPETFRQDVRRCKGTLEDLTGEAAAGYRAPTFSIGRRTAWALDVLAEEGFLYDSSIYPVRHDRYGVPGAPRTPFRARGREHDILELPPATLRMMGMVLPMGGGGTFRLFPLFLMKRAIAQVGRAGAPPTAMLYFHPWEFDADQEQLPLGRLNRFRTYKGVAASRGRFGDLMGAGRLFVRAVDVVRDLQSRGDSLPRFRIGAAEPEILRTRP
ncbi:MAG TPA: XrtA system polysaccharide deacetylase [Gemmataceae bacterium]|nr:XrtA system polysaccharide deacetylase [Gemmataceae bacterium]